MSSPSTDSSGAWSVLDNRLFRTLWIASVASGIGSTLHDTAAVWTMTTLTRSATLVTLMQTVSSLPLFLLALPAGALADMVDRRKVLIAAQVGSLAVTSILAGLSWAGMLTPSLLLGVTFVLGIGVAFTLPTWQALLAEIVERKDLSGALTLGSVGVNISRALGPIIAGVLLVASGPTAAFALNAVSFLGLIIVLTRVKRPIREHGAHAERMIGAMIASIRFTRHSPAIQAVLVRNAAFTFFGIAPVALLPLIVRQRELAAADFGLLMGGYGIGGIATAFLALPELRKSFSADAILTGGTLIFASAAACLSLLEDRIAMGLALFIAGSAWLVCMSTLAVAAQSAFPDWVRARSSAIYLITVQAAMAIGALVWGQVTAISDPAIALKIASGGLLGTLGLSAIFRIGPAMMLNLKPSRHWKDHAFVSELGDDDGPVVVTLEYHIPPEKADSFKRAIAMLRSIRLRDGAYRWFLEQDLEKPDCFFEVFHVGSWGEHLRQHERATEEDRQVEEAVIAYHSATEPPAVTHRIIRDSRV